jgi:hypothetical protein
MAAIVQNAFMVSICLRAYWFDMQGASRYVALASRASVTRREVVGSFNGEAAQARPAARPCHL